MFKVLRFLPMCIGRGVLFPIFGVVGVIATAVYLALQSKEATK